MIGANFLQDKDAPKMTGTEQFPILGRYTTPNKINQMIKCCAGANPYWHCLPKAMIVRGIMTTGVVMIGSLYVWNDKMDANYGYEYNPPLEFHAWWQPRVDTTQIIDIALPGVISRGLITLDNVGPIITGRKPAILNGPPPLWCEYIAFEQYNG